LRNEPWEQVAREYAAAKAIGTSWSVHPKRIARALAAACLLDGMQLQDATHAFAESSKSWGSIRVGLNVLPEEVLDMMDPTLPREDRLTIEDAHTLYAGSIKSVNKLSREEVLRRAHNLVCARKKSKQAMGQIRRGTSVI